ncbi:MAG: hypothetical protein V3V49_00460 [Candidatus Krumholzibacteria bacterium]
MQLTRTLFLLTVMLAAVQNRAAEAIPLYAARAGRACDNCHLTPNKWQNPKLAERKCSLSCQTCHVDPAGGGMRNTSGRFYGRATLPMIATSPRPTRDWDRSFFGRVPRMDRATTYSDSLPVGPDRFEQVENYYETIDDRWSYGRPYGAASRYAPFQGRYGGLAADPLLRIGWDVRLAVLFSGLVITFPMQGDLPVAVHPVRHVTVFLNTGFRGRASGYSSTFDESRTPYLREAFLLLHQAPYQSYVKLGRFTPAYGLRLDDHTSQIRRRFELDGSLPETRVTGVEIGAAPNYPFINLSWFRKASRAREPSPFDIFDVDESWGTALNLGYRDLGWSVGGSLLLQRRPLAEGGDTSTLGAYGVINLLHYRPDLPFTYQTEFDHGSRTRASGLRTDQAAFYQEIDWLLANGVNLLLAHDWADPDREVVDDESNRYAAGGRFTPIPGVTLDGRIRMLVPTAGATDWDLFVQLHLWN